MKDGIRMIDIHSHVIFGVDDGAKTEKDTRDLLEESYRQGVRTIIATPHRRRGMFETDIEIIKENFKRFRLLCSKFRYLSKLSGLQLLPQRFLLLA